MAATWLAVAALGSAAADLGRDCGGSCLAAELVTHPMLLQIGSVALAKSLKGKEAFVESEWKDDLDDAQWAAQQQQLQAQLKSWNAQAAQEMQSMQAQQMQVQREMQAPLGSNVAGDRAAILQGNVQQPIVQPEMQYQVGGLKSEIESRTRIPAQAPPSVSGAEYKAHPGVSGADDKTAILQPIVQLDMQYQAPLGVSGAGDKAAILQVNSQQPTAQREMQENVQLPILQPDMQFQAPPGVSGAGDKAAILQVNSQQPTFQREMQVRALAARNPSMAQFPAPLSFMAAGGDRHGPTSTVAWAAAPSGLPQPISDDAMRARVLAEAEQLKADVTKLQDRGLRVPAQPAAVLTMALSSGLLAQDKAAVLQDNVQQPIAPPERGDPVEETLRGMGLERHAGAFHQQQVTLDEMLSLSNGDLKDLGLLVGERKVYLRKAFRAKASRAKAERAHLKKNSSAHTSERTRP